MSLFVFPAIYIPKRVRPIQTEKIAEPVSKTVKKVLSEAEFEKRGNDLVEKLEGIIPSAQYSKKEAETIDKLKQLLFESETMTKINENNQRLQLMLQRKAKSLEPNSEASGFSAIA